MGPAGLWWYKERGLLAEPETRTNRFGTYEHEEILVRYSGGRVDVRSLGDDYPYGSEVGLPPMRDEDWHTFSDWLEDFTTETMWTLDQLLEEYEKTNPKVRFYDPR
jgi:hypothetical protein